ncbi:S8 family serine peptidase [Candidatus Parcubacteria bacterium]|nr:S8 family serine peptidase [Candidatus Parcubacteria bacterium]
MPKNKIYLQQSVWGFLVLTLVIALVNVRSSYPPGDLAAGSSTAAAVAPDNLTGHEDAKTGVRPDGSEKTRRLSPPTNSRPKKPPAYASDAQVSEKNQTITKNGKTYPLRIYEPQLTPNDPYADQWWVAPTGMQSAWGKPPGAKQTTVAVIDTGFALNHQEFSNRWAYNSGESGATTQEGPSRLNCTDRSLALDKSCNNIDDDFDRIVDNESGPTTVEHVSTLNCTDRLIVLNKSCNRLDDDGNGLADDYLGWDFINFERSAEAGETNPDGDGTQHGSLVTGILGATGNNSVGIAGVNWQTKILPLQALNDDSYGNSYTVADAIYYASDRGVDVISISLGTDLEDPFLREAMLYAQSKGILIVAASGNDGCDCIVYPANYPEVVAVGASNSSSNAASFSNYGSNLDIVAPGTDMTTTNWTKTNKTSAYASGAAGTSFATPFVSGALALLRSQQPDASWDELTGTLFENSDRRSLTAASPRHNSYGFGVTVVDKALNRSIDLFNPPITYRFTGEILGAERIRRCGGSLIPGSFLYELTKSGQVRYSINRYEIRKAENSGWTVKQLFGVCVGLPGDIPDTLRLINLNQELRNQLIK